MDYMTALQAASYDNMQLNEGIFLLGFDYNQYATETALRSAVVNAIEARTGILGATRGGGTFRVNVKSRKIDADGVRYDFVGDTVIDKVEGIMTGTLLEMTPENMAMALGSADVKKIGGKTTVTMRSRIQSSDYKTLCWVGEKKGGGLMLLGLKNALATTGVTFTFRDKDQGTLPFELRAHQDNVTDFDNAPFDIVFFDKAG